MDFPREHGLSSAMSLRDLVQRTSYLITVVTRLLTITTVTRWEKVLREREFISAWFQRRIQGTITRYPSSGSPIRSRRPTFRLRAGLAQFGPERPLLPLSPTSSTFQPSRYTFSSWDMIPIFTPARSLTPTPGDSPSSSGHSLAPRKLGHQPTGHHRTGHQRTRPHPELRPACACATRLRTSRGCGRVHTPAVGANHRAEGLNLPATLAESIETHSLKG